MTQANRTHKILPYLADGAIRLTVPNRLHPGASQLVVKEVDSGWTPVAPVPAGHNDAAHAVAEGIRQRSGRVTVHIPRAMAMELLGWSAAKLRTAIDHGDLRTAPPTSTTTATGRTWVSLEDVDALIDQQLDELDSRFLSDSLG